MKEIAVISGRSARGKESLLVSLAVLGSPVAIADCSFEYNGLRQILAEDQGQSVRLPFFRGFSFDEERCSHCRQCLNICHQQAIAYKNDKVQYYEYRCSHCGSCIHWCPLMVLGLEEQSDISLITTETRIGPLVYTASLLEPSLMPDMIKAIRGKARNLAKQQTIPYILINGSRGINDTSYMALTGVDMVLIVVSPSVWAVEDLADDVKMSRLSGAEPWIIQNMTGLDTGFDLVLDDYCTKNKLKIAGKIPADAMFRRALSDKKSIVEYLPESAASASIRLIWQKMSTTVTSLDV